jgi:hypothetical protein
MGVFCGRAFYTDSIGLISIMRWAVRELGVTLLGPGYKPVAHGRHFLSIISHQVKLGYFFILNWFNKVFSVLESLFENPKLSLFAYLKISLVFRFFGSIFINLQA